MLGVKPGVVRVASTVTIKEVFSHVSTLPWHPRKDVKGLAPVPSTPARSPNSAVSPLPGPLSTSVPLEEREVIKVNNYNTSELKNACDDALKRYLSRPALFKQIHLHTDVRLVLGWAGVFTAAATGLYGWKTDFEKSKPGVWVGFILYLVLTSLQTLYSYFVEGDTIFVGRRKTFSKRIMTERITISSRTVPVPSSGLSLKPSPTNSPSYSLSINYVQSTSGGKSLLAKGRTHETKHYSAFFDEKGVMAQEVFERWIGELVEAVMEGKGA